MWRKDDDDEVSMTSDDGSVRDADLVVGGGGRAFGGN